MQESQLFRSFVIALGFTVVCVLVLDQPFARWLATRETWPALWNDGIHYLEFPLGIEPYKWTGVWILAGGSILTLAIPRLRGAAYAFTLVTLVHLLDRNITMWMKFGTGRLRPTQWFARGGDVFWRDGGYSFPSGHAVLFASIVVPLAVVYPRTRPLLAIAVFACTARVMVNAHFLSDVIAGYALVALTTWACVKWLSRWLPSSIRPASLR